MIKVSDAMVKKVQTIDGDKSIEEAIKIMGKSHVGSLIVTKKGKNELPTAGLNLEERLENWLDNDISIISDELFVIGR
ncbi:MAG: CBS domain-containing protein [Thaumarchaeota archaeon]|nr:CBS domain-containing protein [Nitrososphaerota archaeon]